jgi:hypothetical protein
LFTIFFPFLVIFVTGGVLLEIVANLLGERCMLLLLLVLARIANPSGVAAGGHTGFRMLHWHGCVKVFWLHSYYWLAVLLPKHPTSTTTATSSHPCPSNSDCCCWWRVVARACVRGDF